MDRQHVTCGAEAAGHHRNKGIRHLTVRPRSDLQDRTTWNKASRDQQKESNQRIMYMHVYITDACAYKKNSFDDRLRLRDQMTTPVK